MATLKQQWDALKAARPDWNSSDTSRGRTARELGLSEAASLVLDLNDDIFPLAGDARDLLAAFPRLGRVRALTQTQDAVIEAFGDYPQLMARGHKLRGAMGAAHFIIFAECWRYAFHVREFLRSEIRTAIQFFSPSGHALHKVFILAGSNQDEYARFVQQFRAPHNDFSELLQPLPPAAPPALTEADGKKLRNFWDKVKYPRATADLLHSTGFTRGQTLEYAPPEVARPVPPALCRELLETAHANHAPLFVGVRNQGMMHHYNGPLVNLRQNLNVIDPDFHLHLRDAEAAQAWLIRKSYDDTTAYGLELLNQHGDGMAVFHTREGADNAVLEFFRRQWQA